MTYKIGNFTIEEGKPVHLTGFEIRESNGTLWYRHDTVYEGDKKLEGTIQVRKRRIAKNRFDTDVTTCFRGGCVVGSRPDWLKRMNENPLPQLG